MPMNLLDGTLLTYWLSTINILLPQLFAVIIVWLILLRMKSFRSVIQHTDSKKRCKLMTMLVFSLFAIYGTYKGIPVDISVDTPNIDALALTDNESKVPSKQHARINFLDIWRFNALPVLSEQQALITFRDTWVFIAGFKGGLWAGIGVGLLAGIHRYCIYGGFSAGNISFAKFFFCTYSGVISHYRPQWTKTAPQLLGVVLVGTGIMHIALLFPIQLIFVTFLLAVYSGAISHYRPQWTKTAPQLLIAVLIGMAIICIKLFPIQSFDDTLRLIKLVSIPTTVLSIAGCLLFIWLMSDLDRDHQMQLLQQAELRVLRAQIDPHFLNNALNDIKGVIKKSDPAQGVHYICELAEFFNHTREYAMLNTIKLELELEQLKRFLAIKRLSYGDKLKVDFNIADELLPTPVLSGCLLTIVENSLKHAFKDKSPPFQLFIRAEKQGTDLILSVRDNGRGFTPALFDALGNHPIASHDNGGGVALFQLKQRLYLLFEDKANLSFSNANGAAVIRLIHPIIQPSRE
jgi:LytS/YehU family sensor histidine kinase